jgi:cyclopropane-fatty-acyl-phospholipid synthase
MSLVAAAASAVERFPVPDTLARAGIAMLVNRTGRLLDRINPDAERDFLRAMSVKPIACVPQAANAQHYELPSTFFAQFLGLHRKYSCCLYTGPENTLDQAEEWALSQTAAHAALRDGQRVLELGCGWGSLSLWMAQRFPRSQITAVSNSTSQRTFIKDEVTRRGLKNLQVVTADMNHFDTNMRFDRIVSVEMWEHMSNWQVLLARVRKWIEADGLLFLHVFSHSNRALRVRHK